MLKTGRYKSDPFSVHRRIDGLSPALFERWLALFAETCRALFGPDEADALQARASQIAASLRAGLFFRPSNRA